LSDSPRKPKSKDYTQDGEGVFIVEGQATRYPETVNESTVSKLARNENITDTIVEERKNNRIQNVETSTKGSTWSEPETQYNAKYPYNHVYESESGHVLEVDDTPGAERIQTTHRSGTFEEIYPDGTKVTKVVKDKYEIVMSDNNVLIMGDCNITINGQGKIFVKGSADVKVDGDMTTQVAGTYSVTSSSYMSFRAPRIDLN
jgi:hypothetical protein